MTKGVSNKELVMMDLLWEEKGLTAKEIEQRLYPDAATSQHGTVQKLLQRLEHKGFIRCNRNVKPYLYSYVISRETYSADQLMQVADPVKHTRFFPNLLTHLIKKERITKEQIQSIREVLEELDPESEAD